MASPGGRELNQYWPSEVRHLRRKGAIINSHRFVGIEAGHVQRRPAFSANGPAAPTLYGYAVPGSTL